MTTHDTEALVAALTALAEANIPTDVQELLLLGDPMRGIPPGALAKAIAALAQRPAEAVAFLHETEWGDRSLSFEKARNHQWSSTPLYASPVPASVGDGVTVKKLEWTDEDGWSQALGYRVEAGDNGRFYARSNHASGLFGTFEFATSMDGAKAAAQADYERRILSALSGAEAPAQGWRELPNDEATHDYVLQYGGRCRDCADNFGVCESRGMPCDPKAARKAARHVIGALNYGHRNGFLPAAPQQEGR